MPSARARDALDIGWAHVIGTERQGAGDFPGGTVERNLPASAGDTGLVPGLGRSHIWQGNEAWVPQAESSPRSLQLEKARAQQ